MKATPYVAHTPGPDGRIPWSEVENATWQTLIARQSAELPGWACDEYCAGLARLNLPRSRVPQLDEVGQVLEGSTGWSVAAVPALISFDRFFSLLAQRRFPVATFIRRPEDLDYLQEPDIFHEIYGHCPLLTNPAFAHFTQVYGQLGLAACKEERVYLARLYWFTVEFGLLRTAAGLRLYGGGILSSIGETRYALGAVPQVAEFDLIEVLRTPYRIDIMQPLYFALSRLDDLFELAERDIMGAVHQAMRLGLRAPLFPPKPALAG
ncbi:phenylalanine 4-monooxygenase [Aeromonas simiae]|uniref:Phenylalanine-4-hydroxylase n=1 Tax=Aeromonas simiae TaxID=218936 RepID=A0A5J6WVR4_9GAMM|nr:phenylalanine 4-monooxygenase [Aeromonas simiae]QFI54860.1 phenylalanine 4-monooxygenase [Aeromonas simiae]